VSVEEVTKAI